MVSDYKMKPGLINKAIKKAKQEVAEEIKAYAQDKAKSGGVPKA